MKKVVKQVVGIDVAQGELVCCFGKRRTILRLNRAAVLLSKTTEHGLEK